jgi:hypothetical protein
MSHHAPHGHLRRFTSGTFLVHICAFLAVILHPLSDTRATTQLAKMIKYMGGSLSCDIVFGLFMFAWLITRHILFMLVIASIYADFPYYSQFRWDPLNGYYASERIYIAFMVLMSLLQVSSVSYLRRIGD